MGMHALREPEEESLQEPEEERVSFIGRRRKARRRRGWNAVKNFVHKKVATKEGWKQTIENGRDNLGNLDGRIAIVQNSLCKCKGGGGYGNHCKHWDSDGVWCYLKGGHASYACPGAALSSSRRRAKYWSRKAC